MVVLVGGRPSKARTRIVIVLFLALLWWGSWSISRYKPAVRARFSSRVQEARKEIPDIRLDWKPKDVAPAPYNVSKLALLIEHRPIPHLVPQILHMIAVVPPDWRFLFIGSHQSVYDVEKSFAIKHHQVSGKLDLMVLPQPWTINTPEAVFRMLADERFYDEFLPDAEWILKYEHDNILCANYESTLNDWLNWSWAWSARVAYNEFASNGGLTLRRVSAIKRLLSFQRRYNDSEPEDEWFGRRMAAMPGERVALRFDGAFAVDTTVVEKPIGYNSRGIGVPVEHRSWKSTDARKRILEYCPELGMVMGLRLERELCAEVEFKIGNQFVPAHLATKKVLEDVTNGQEAQRHEVKPGGVGAAQDAGTRTDGIAGAILRQSPPPPLPPMSKIGSPSKLILPHQGSNGVPKGAPS